MSTLLFQHQLRHPRKKTNLLVGLSFIPLLGLLWASAQAAPLPGTLLDMFGNPLPGGRPNSTFTLVDESMNATRIGVNSGVLGLDATVIRGIVPVKEPGVNFDPNDPTTWSDVIIFTNSTDPVFRGGIVQALSDPVFRKDMKATDPAAFGTDNDAAGTFTYTSSNQTYVFTETGKEVADVPEPSTLVMLLCGLVSLLGLRRSFIIKK